MCSIKETEDRLTQVNGKAQASVTDKTVNGNIHLSQQPPVRNPNNVNIIALIVGFNVVSLPSLSDQSLVSLSFSL